MKDPLSNLRATIRHEDRRARAIVLRIKRGVLVVFAAIGGLGFLILQIGAGDCRGGSDLCGETLLRGASMGLGPTMAPPEPPRQSAAMAAALAARASAERASGERINPARAAAERAAAARAAQAGAAQPSTPMAPASQRRAAAAAGSDGDVIYFTDIVPRR
jgi:hypothetical protein